MRILTAPIGRATRSVAAAWHLTIYLLSNIVGNIWVLRGEYRHLPPSRWSRDIRKMCRWYLLDVIAPCEFFTVDGDLAGRCNRLLDKPQRRQRRRPRDLRRRHVTMLLQALGRSPAAVEDALTRHWHTNTEGYEPFDLLEDYLASRLRHRDPLGCQNLEAFPRAIRVGGTWVATPKPVRRYLHHRDEHEWRLRQQTRRH